MKATLKREGDRFTLTGPVEVLEASGLQEGEVDVSPQQQAMRVARPKITLEAILAELREKGPRPP